MAQRLHGVNDYFRTSRLNGSDEDRVPPSGVILLSRNNLEWVSLSPGTLLQSLPRQPSTEQSSSDLLRSLSLHRGRHVTVEVHEERRV